MNVQRFVGKNAREAMALVRAACGEDAVVLSNRPVPGGVEILAMAGDEVPGPQPTALPAPAAATKAPEAAPPMSTVSFQEYVRERQRQEAAAAKAQAAAPAAPALPAVAAPARPVPAARRAPVEPGRFARQQLAMEEAAAALPPISAPPVAAPEPAPERIATVAASPATEATAQQEALLAELRTLRQDISRQLSGLAWFDDVRRSPAQTRLLRLLIGNGFSTGLARALVQRLPDDVPDAQAEPWLLSAVSHNLRCGAEDTIQQKGGVYALVGPTGVGKTTTTAKIAARFAQQHGAASVGLITVDTYRMAGSDQLRAFGQLLNIPVHTARDVASLTELLDLFSGKKLVLIDTVGLAQKDRRLAQLLASLPSPRITRLLVLNAGAQGDTLEQVVQAYGSGSGTRCVITKLDEAARCGPAIDVALRHKLVVEGIANGQRVPEDWHRASAQLLAQKALMKPTGSFAPDDAGLGLLLTLPPATSSAGGAHA